ncbi:MAG: carboxypeptidase regulatory-like domain-containing protein [Acidobacteriota bacterium]|nr:carboxypeptidase regulatory-like domain-containing protein [Acidobacteriota bacterium]
MFRLFFVLTVPLVLIAQTANQAGVAGTVAGRVSDSQSGIGIGGANIQLFPRGQTGNLQPLRTTSLEDGSFLFESVPAGNYLLYVSHSNYTSAGNTTQTISVNSGQQVANLVLPLQPFGTISGKVVDQAGAPVAGASLQLFNTFSLRGKPQLRRVQNATANGNGEYLFQKVVPGTYYVSADTPSADRPATRDNSATQDKSATETAKPAKDSNGLSSIRTYYPRSAILEGASAVEVAPADSPSGINISLQQAATFHVRGKIESLLPGALRKGTALTLSPRDTSAIGGSGRAASTRADGSTFDIARVPSGSYSLWLLGSYAGVDGSRRGRRPRLLARQDVDVNGADVNDVTLSLMPPVNLTGRLALLNPPTGINPAQIRISLQPAGQTALGSFQMLSPGADGSFAAQDLEPGDYMVRVSNVPAGMYVESIQLNRQDVQQTGIDLSQGGGGELVVTLRPGAGDVNGTLANSGGSNQPGSGLALLVPEKLSADGSGVLSGQLRAGGTFSVANVAPGRYFAFAVEHWSSIWQNVDFVRAMEREGTPLDVEQNGHAQVQLRLLTLDDLQQAAARLGLSAQ